MRQPSTDPDRSKGFATRGCDAAIGPSASFIGGFADRNPRAAPEVVPQPAPRRLRNSTGPRSLAPKENSTRPAAIGRGPTNGAAESARKLTAATAQAALDAARARKLAYLVRDPSTRITQAAARGGFLRGEREKLEKEVSTLRQLPRPKSASILSKSPVARPANSTESHFELRHNRVSFIDLERLLEMTKADAQLRIRMSDQMPAISNKVGPVGSFSLEYELVKSVPSSMEELIECKAVRRDDLRAWEIVPEFEGRGETYEGTQNPISDLRG